MDYEMTDVLSHHGILGQKWGERNGPPYPLSGGDHSAAEKRLAKRGISTLTEYLSNREKEKKKKAAVEKARQTKIQNEEKRKTEEEHNAAREKALKSGSAADVLKFQGELSYNELQSAINRINAEKQLSSIAASDIKTAADKVDTIIDKIDKGREWVDKGTKAYNTVAKIINAFSDEDNLPIIGEKHQSKADKAKEALDIKKKQLENENQKLKNQLQSLQNRDQSLKNEQTEMNMEAQRQKAADKAAERKRQETARKKAEREQRQTEGQNRKNIVDEDIARNNLNRKLIESNASKLNGNSTNKRRRKKK